MLLLFYNLLFGIIASSIFGFYLGRLNVYVIIISSLVLSLLLSILSINEIILSLNILNIFLFEWLKLIIYSIDFLFYYDSLTIIMLFTIVGISTLVHIYSIGYLEYDPYLIRFLFFLTFFTFCMLLLVTASNFLQMFLGWEGVGLCSYLLINFWYTRVLANKAALKAMIMNRISDVIFILGVVLLLLLFYNTDYNLVFDLINPYLNLGYNKIVFFYLSLNMIDLICFFLFMGSVGKSAQLGLHTWLPDAMEGPTPVSSLLHAATMVTAGVFLILRCSILFELSTFIRTLVTLIGGMTALFAGLTAMQQFDIKKVIAYSTCSQLGYMFFSAGLSYYHIAIFHLFNHAFFKALLFLSAGSVIHALSDEQDMRKMSALSNILPFSYTAFWIGSLAIMGFPFLAGFYSKDLILEAAYSRFILEAPFIYFLGVFAALCTAIYSIRLLVYVFGGRSASWRTVISHSHESTSFMFFSIFVLSILALFVGYLGNDLFSGFGILIWSNSLILLPDHNQLIEAMALNPFIKHFPLFITLYFSIQTFFHFNTFYFSVIKRTLGSYVFQSKNFFSAFWFHAAFFNIFYNNLLLILFNISYQMLNKLLDKGLFDFPYLFYIIFKFLNNIIVHSISYLIFFYIFYMFFSIELLFLIIIFNKIIFFCYNLVLCILWFLFNKYNKNI